MLRSAVVLLVASVALTTSLSAGASPRTRHGPTAEADQVTLRAKFHQGPWKKSLSLRLVKLRLISFQLCAIWNYQAGAAFDCDAAARNKLPAGTTMRLEQNPVAKAVRRADSPGWGMLGTSSDGGLGAVLSQLVSGNRRGTFHYRVTLRDRSSHILATSNTFTLVWR